MLYDLWRKVAAAKGGAWAVRELATNRVWTFAELAEHVESAPPGRPGLRFPQGHSAEFIFSVLRAWRDQACVCPLEADQSPPPLPVPPAAFVHLKSTSATTGQARLVAFTGRQLAADADNIMRTMGLRPDWPNLAAISLAHSYGFSNLILPLLLHGVPLILAPSPLPEILRRSALGFPDVTLAGVPALWRAWHEADAIPPSVRLAISAGAPLPIELEQAVFSQRGLKIHNFYGSSECGGIAYDPGSQPRTDGSFVGTPLAQVHLELGAEGCLRVCGDAVAETYWPESEPALSGGRFQTSDLVTIQDGAVYLHGRAGELIHLAGRKVAPAVIEQALRQHAGVRQCLVFAVPSPDATRTDAIVACVDARPEVGAEALKAFLLARLPAWQVPRTWWFVDALAANHRGKISPAEWRAKFLSRDASDPLDGRRG